ncbi:MAG: hypothetical protein EOS26_21465 [Mesorhizobium sp.]|nr:MAG: hypothetical protein EOS26_21465 [Mesorhizobium sp.]
MLAADNLHAQATALARAKGKGLIVQIDANDKVLGHWDEANKAVFLLGGSPLENAIKAFLIYENPTSWISNGGLARHLKSHSPVELQSRSRLIPYKNRHRLVLATFEIGLESWASYRCALSVEASAPEPAMTNAI